MARLFVGNFDFEHQLQHGAGWQPPDRIARLNAELASSWLSIAEDGDFIWTPQPIEPGFFEQLAVLGFPRVRPIRDVSELPEPVQICPWGASSEIAKWASTGSVEAELPPNEAVRQANSRSFSAELEHELGVALPCATVLRRIEELPSIIERTAGEFRRQIEEQKWVIKSEFSMSARERIIGSGTNIDEQMRNWIVKRLGESNILFFEPWVNRVSEVGLQFDVPKSGEPQFVGIAEMMTDSLGVYRGSWIHASDAANDRLKGPWRKAIDVGFNVAERVQRLGYFGPLGIDALKYAGPGGQIMDRPIQDINARFTMGRLSLGWRRFIKTNQTAFWLHVPWRTDSQEPDEWMANRRDNLPEDINMTRMSPLRIADKSTQHGTVLFSSNSESILKIGYTEFSKP